MSPGSHKQALVGRRSQRRTRNARPASTTVGALTALALTLATAAAGAQETNPQCSSSVGDFIAASITLRGQTIQIEGPHEVAEGTDATFTVTASAALGASTSDQVEYFTVPNQFPGWGLNLPDDTADWHFAQAADVTPATTSYTFGRQGVGGTGATSLTVTVPVNAESITGRGRKPTYFLIAALLGQPGESPDPNFEGSLCQRVLINTDPETVQQSAATGGVSAHLGAVDVGVDLNGIFIDSSDDVLVYSAAVADERIATAAVDGARLQLTPRRLGSTTITVTATDRMLQSATYTIPVQVTETPVLTAAKGPSSPSAASAQAGDEVAALQVRLTASARAVPVTSFEVAATAAGAGRTDDIELVRAYLDANGNGRHDGGEPELGRTALRVDGTGTLPLSTDLTVTPGTDQMVVFSMAFQRHLRVAGAAAVGGVLLLPFAWVARQRRTTRRPGPRRLAALATLAVGLLLLASCQAPISDPGLRSYVLTVTDVAVTVPGLIRELPPGGIPGAAMTISSDS